MLASIQQIKSLRPIPNADFIETATVLGWEVVVKKGEFKPGDLCIYVEIDTLIPNREWSEFLFKGSDEGKDYYRLRTIKLKKQISQGLVLPLNILPEGILDQIIDYNALGEDVSNDLEIKHYEKPLPNYNPKSGIQAKGHFPSFLRKTDEERIQNHPEWVDDLQGKPYYITLKLDGTSATFYKYKNKFGVCSRNLELKNPYSNLNSFFDLLKDKIKLFFKIGQKNRKNPRTHSVDVYWRMADKYKIEEWLPDGYAIQGEIVGPGIQANRLGLQDTELYVFNLWNIETQKYLYPGWAVGDRWEDITFVPNVDDGYPSKFDMDLEELIELANSQNYDNGTPAEGIVVRSLDQSISFKVVSNRFLLEYGE